MAKIRAVLAWKLINYFYNGRTTRRVMREVLVNVWLIVEDP